MVCQFSFLNCSGLAESPSPDQLFEQACRGTALDWRIQTTGPSFEALCSRAEMGPYVLEVFIIDECQMAYRAKMKLWHAVKSALAPKPRRIFFLLLAAYGEQSTVAGGIRAPTELANCQTISLPFMRLRTAEREELFARLEHFAPASRVFPVPTSMCRLSPIVQFV
jgi:hypothetical protein